MTTESVITPQAAEESIRKDLTRFLTTETSSTTLELLANRFKFRFRRDFEQLTLFKELSDLTPDELGYLMVLEVAAATLETDATVQHALEILANEKATEGMKLYAQEIIWLIKVNKLFLHLFPGGAENFQSWDDVISKETLRVVLDRLPPPNGEQYTIQEFFDQYPEGLYAD